MLRKIKGKLRRKAIVKDVFVKEKKVVYIIELKNFWYLLRKIRVLINDEVNLNVKTLKNKRILQIEVPFELLEESNRFSLSLEINNEQMWLQKGGDINKNNNWFVSHNNFYEMKIRKKILVYKSTTENVDHQGIDIKNINISNNKVTFEWDDEVAFKGEFGKKELYYISKGEFRKYLVNTMEKNNQLTIDGFELLRPSENYLFIRHNNTMYPLNWSSARPKVFRTYLHEISIKSEYGIINLGVKKHSIVCDKVRVTKGDNEKVSLTFSFKNLPIANKYQLVMIDRNNNEKTYDLSIDSNLLYCSIPEKELLLGLNNKRFTLLIQQEMEHRYNIHLRRDGVEGDYKNFTKTMYSEELEVSFYRRKNKLPGLSVKRPKPVKIIESMDDFILNGYIDGLDNFHGIESILVIEERETNKNISIVIDKLFEIDLNNELQKLIPLMSRSKCVFDFFLLICDENGIVRKEKIKYPHGLYKKDNYFERKFLLDEKGNQFCFLFTITPAQNVKIETFMVPKDAKISEDTSVKDNNVWLVGERYNTAQDNGIVFFRWLLKNTSIDAYYVIDENASDYELIKDEENIIVFGSKQHFEIATKAGVLLGTHDLENLLPYKQAKGFFHYENTVKVFLQHGVLGRKNVEYHKEYYETPFDLFIVSSNPEKYDVVIDQLGYEENEVKVTGLARFDNLVQKNKPQDILVMPTWRDWLNTEKGFLESKYFAYYKSLLENNKLIQALEEYNVKIHFYPHYRARKYFDDALNLNVNNVKLVPFEEKSVQELLIDNALLITDYSSVSFDFLYLNKPVIYYQFDEKRFFRSGILRPLDETSIGMVGQNEEEIVYYIIDRIKNSFTNYSVDTSTVLSYKDQQNCQRIYEAVLEKVHENVGVN